MAAASPIVPQSPDHNRARGFARALIVDDHPLFCDALALTLRAVSGVIEIDTAHSLTDALARLDTAPPPDLLLLDLDLPDIDGLDGLLRLRAAHPDLPVLVVSSMTEPRLVQATIAAGARGFVPKHSGRDSFRAALDALARGEIWLPETAQQAAGDEAADSVARLAQLTRQQARILDLLCQGRLNKQIAFELSIAETTVKAHVTAIMRKLGVQSRTQAVLIAQQARFTSFVPEG
ncbi:response regulator transcription factor [Rhodobacter sp. NTK016B]|uniref:response regulator transcription factor n=1 Tax=Rhodobacter sp. NTK016B TaxID=2759676 RepID=UPI001A90726E|nr:response regulator transcription factor [Rhodobacter sp. NTK016B]MBN8292288.1 response regulator transcription factor [Rhodobacter sp. NTK016B]